MNSVNLKTEELSFGVIEELKILRTNIEYSGDDKKVIMLTSSQSGEGKSTLSFELAKSIAEFGKKVLFVDCDMRNSKFHEKVVGERPRGLSYYLSGQSGLDDVCCTTNTNNLHCILAGRVPPNPAELLNSSKMTKLMTWARENYDFVIMDTPPINLVVDTSIIAKLVDGAIAVVKSGAIHRRTAINTIKQLERTEVPILGVVLSQVANTGGGYYGKYGKTGEYYGFTPDEKFKKMDSDKKKK